MSNHRYRQINYIWLLLLPLFGVSILLGSTSWAGGWTSSGGGSGVVCFMNVKSARQAEATQAVGKPLPKNLINAISSVEPLDFYEANQEVRNQIIDNWHQFQGETHVPSQNSQDEWTVALKGIQQRIKFLSPLMGLTLEALNKKMEEQTWVKLESLPLMDDQYDPSVNQNQENLQTLSLKIKKKAPRCRLFQIIKRSSVKSVGTPTANQDRLIPEDYGRFQIEYVDVLFTRMSALGQAMLYLHEQLYLMGSSLGHPSSEIVRYWVREFVMLREENIFLSPQLKFVVPPSDHVFDHRPEEEGFQHPKPPAWLRVRMTQSFGDYIFYYFKEWGEPIAKADPRSSFAVFTQMLRQSRTFMESCLNTPQTKSERSLCFNLMLSSVFSSSEMNDQQEYLYLVWLYYGAAPNGQLNYEYIVTPDSDAEIAEQRSRAQALICRQIQTDLSDSSKQDLDEELLVRMHKALAYCVSSKISVSK